MFCDLVGSTAMSHRLDPEDLREVIGRYREWTSQLIARYEGFVARYMGDGMLVYFGYPQAHENDARGPSRRASRSSTGCIGRARARVRIFGARLSVRIGIATGMVVVGDLLAEGALDEAAVMGETPNVAARLQALAKPNTVVVAPTTRDLAGGTFDYADAGRHKLKGLQQPMQVWRVLQASAAPTRFDAAHGRRLAPIVGRTAETEALLAAWLDAQRGHGHLVLLSGEAGIGKSRLAESLVERTGAPFPQRLLFQCSPHHANSALYPFIQELERSAGFARRDSAAQKRDKLIALLTRVALADAPAASLFAALLSLPAASGFQPPDLEPDERKRQTLVALLDRLRRLAATTTVLMLIEDTHWIDPTSLELLDMLADALGDMAALVVVTSRLAPLESWKARPHTSAVHLERLDRQHSTQMVRELLARKRFPARLVDEIVARTDGVPLFIEELTRTLATTKRRAQPLHERLQAIPATLQDSLMARLDQLGPAKDVAQIGAVIGREFSSELVAAVAQLDAQSLQDGLRALAASGLLQQRADAAGSAYVFKHALVQDAAYESLLRARRQELHRRIAQTLEESYAERVQVEPEVLAHHWAQAREWLRAARYAAAAGRRALDRSATPEALGHATHGLQSLAAAAAGTERDALELSLEVLRGAAFRAERGFASSDAERSFMRAQALCERLGETRGLIDVRRGLFSCYYARGALSQARHQATEVIAAGSALHDASSRMLGHWMLGCVTFWQGEFAVARNELEEASALYDPHEQRAKTLALQIDPGVNALCHLGWTLWILGLPQEALATGDRALTEARALGQPFAEAMALFFACTTRACCGQHEAGRPLLEELAAVTARHRLRYLGSCARVLEGQALIAQDRCAAGLEQIGRAFAEFQAQEAGVGLPWAMSIAIEAHARMGAAAPAQATLARAFEAVERNGEHHWEAELYRLQGELHRSLPPLDPTPPSDRSGAPPTSRGTSRHARWRHARWRASCVCTRPKAGTSSPIASRTSTAKGRPRAARPQAGHPQKGRRHERHRSVAQRHLHADAHRHPRVQEPYPALVGRRADVELRRHRHRRVEELRETLRRR